MDEGRCGGCWTMLAVLCTAGQDARLCEAFTTYDRTGDVAALDLALAVAPPALLHQARQQVVALGLATALE